MPVAMISTSTSPALGPSRSSSTISNGFLASKATAARVFMSLAPWFAHALPPLTAWAKQGKRMDAMGWANGRHALITGGGTGIGAATARMLAAEGAKVTLLGRRREPLEVVAGQIGATAIACDVTDRGAIERAYDEARVANGMLDFAILNAGVGDSAPFQRTKREAWDRIIATNLTALFDGAQLALPDLLEGEDKRLV